MKVLDFCKRICDEVGMSLNTNFVGKHYSNRNENMAIGFYLSDDIWWASMYIFHSDRLLYVGWSEKDGYWLQENPTNGNVFDHKRSKTLAPCLRELKKIIQTEGVLLYH